MDESYPNPIRRIREEQKLTLKKLAELLQVNYQALYLNEQGVYPTILPRIRDYFASLGIDVHQLDEEYAQYVAYQRKTIKEILHTPLFELPEPGLDRHPFIKFREKLGLSRMGFSKMFATHPAFLYKLERREARGLSTQLKTALLDAGFEPGIIEELDFRVQEYYDYGGYYEQDQNVVGATT